MDNVATVTASLSSVPAAFNAGPNPGQKLIDDELLALDKRALQLRTERNARAEISKLPAEVLGQIFTTLSTSCSVGSWYQINVVCRQWRATALENVALWTNPPTHHHELSLLMLERSRMAELNVAIRPATPIRTLIAILKHIGRIQSLTLNDVGSNLLSHCVSALRHSEKSCLRLKKLTIEYNASHHVSSSFLNRFPLEILPIPGLTLLVLNRVSVSARLTVPRLLLTLRDMPHLQVLTIGSDVIDYNAPVIGSDITPNVILPHLVSFRVLWQATHQHVGWLLSHLQLPQLGFLEIICNSDTQPFDQSAYSAFLRTVLSVVPSGNFSGLDTFVTCSDRWFQLIRRSEADTTISHGLVIYMLGYSGMEEAIPVFSFEVVASLSDQIMSNLVRFELHDKWPVDDDILPFLARLHNLEIIKVDLDLVEMLARALPITSPAIILPKLQQITIMAYKVVSDYDPVVQNLCHSLRHRHQHGAVPPVNTLYVDTACISTASPLYLLSEIGIEVVHDDI